MNRVELWALGRWLKVGAAMVPKEKRFMLQNILHWLAIVAQAGNAVMSVDGLIPPKYAVMVAGGVAALQWVVHLLDPKAPSIGVKG